MSGNVFRLPATRCANCGNWIRVMAFKGTHWCSELCRKALVRRGQA